MCTIAQMLARAESIDPIKVAGESMLANEQEIIKVNQNQLYEKGIGKDGRELPPYSPAYAKSKPSRGVVDIYKTGRLYKAMQLNVDGDTYSLFSEVPYAQYVVGKRPTVFGLTDEGKKFTWNIIRPDFVGKVRGVLQV